MGATWGSPQIVTDGLQFYVDAANTKSYPGSGTTWTDISGNGNDGTLTNGPTFDSANLGSIVFDGTDDYVSLGTYPTGMEQVQVPLSICAWVKADVVSSLHIIWGVYNIPNSHGIYSLLRIDNSVLRYYASNTSGTFQFQNGPTLSNNTFYFLTVTVSGSIASPTVKYYVNDSLDSTHSYGALSSTPQAGIEFKIGSNQGSTELWDGNIYNVMWYNKELSLGEVQQNFNAIRGRYGL